MALKHGSLTTLVTAILASACLPGCVWERWQVLRQKPKVETPAETLVLRGDRLDVVETPNLNTASAELEAAHDLYRRGEYRKAETLFEKIADDKKQNPRIAEEARYFQAECLRHQGRYPKAADVYSKLLNDFPGGVHREQAVRHLFDIANYWLDDTRAEMKAYQEKREGKRWFVWSGPVPRFDKSKPFLDQEGRAIAKLEQVSYSSINGPLADNALFMIGSVMFYRENYREADYYFSQIVERYPDSEYAQRAIELAIICKHMSTGGPLYDGRKVAEARKLVQTAMLNYPELATQKRDFLERQLAGINRQQAEKDFHKAEFYRRTGHPGSAYFYYEIVRRRYPGSPLAEKATQRMAELKRKYGNSVADASANKDAQPSPVPMPAPMPAPLDKAPDLASPAKNGTDASPEAAPKPRKLPFWR
ncbi:MAG: hypothetical protein KatS3mg105_0181 [Gemmatales bacterium]|nr:MAG: hypothetical protein KatS3mg105_0181 [Gemmatales bacterium]